MGDGQLPLYVRLAQNLRQEIRGKRYLADDILPGERGLASRYGVSQATARNAVRLLREERAVCLKRGVGYVVQKPPSLHDVVIRPGDTLESRMPTDHERDQIGAPVGAPILFIFRKDGTQEVYDSNTTRIVAAVLQAPNAG